MATLDTKSIDPFSHLGGFNFDKETELFNQLMEASNALPDPRKVKYTDELASCLVGRLIKWHVADGHAWYKVTSAKPLKLLHLHFCDGYTVDACTIRGLRLIDVAGMVANDVARQEYFNKTK